MSITDDDAAGRVWWGIRRYWWVVVAATLVATGLALTGPARSVVAPDRRYEASALVVATSLQIKPEQLPRAAQAIFNGGTVAEAVADEADVPVDPQGLIPKRVRLEALNDTIALRVIGLDHDPEIAAQLANLTANAFVNELNEIGEGVGAFKVQDSARPPATRPRQTGAVVPLAIGLLGGASLGLGLVMLLLFWRRPVLSLSEARQLAGVDGGSIVSMPRSGRVILPETVGGIALVARQLWPSDRGVAALVGVGQGYRLRNEVVRVLAMAQSRRSPVDVIAPEREGVDALALALSSASGVRVLQDWLLHRLQAAGPQAGMGSDSAVLMSVSAADFDVPQLLPAEGRALLLVPEGTPASAVEEASQQFPLELLVGVVVVRRGAWRTKESARSGRAAATKGRPRPAPEADAPADVHGGEGSGKVAARRGIDGRGSAHRGEGENGGVGHQRDQSSPRPAQPEETGRR